MMALTSTHWVILVTMLAASIVVAWVLRQIIVSLIKQLIRRVSGDVPDIGIVRSAARSLALMIVAESDSVLLPILNLPDPVTIRVGTTLDVLSIAFLAIALYRFIDLVCARAVLHVMRARTDGHEIAETLAPLVASTLKVLVAVVGSMTVLGFLGVNVAAIITGLSIGGAALALASQDTVKNLFGSLVIITDRPFVVGDWISTPGAEGIVREIGFRSTRIVTPTGSLITLSNGKLADATIDNIGIKKRHQLSTAITLDAASSKVDIETFVERLRGFLAQSADVMQAEPMSVAIREISPSGIVINIMFHIRASRQPEAAGILHQLHLTVLTLADEASVTLAKATS
ncbi:MAG: mechanosensitive ion channel family protein [Candidatus Kapabacteria bacterium]|nr:mechanosensitive ion channel family protein [Candidatus Kapabacteria bacterium]